LLFRFEEIAMPLNTTKPSPRPAPPRYKLALLTWLGAYGIITAILAVLGPAIEGWPLAARTLLISALMVLALTWVVVPTLTRLFRSWLVRPAAPPRAVDCGAQGRPAAIPAIAGQRSAA
jgi:antibiotic biosynthesis monooxygenase (ABM) superfamily enzyme